MQRSTNADPLFRKNKILKLEDLVTLETLKLMFNSKKYLEFISA